MVKPIGACTGNNRRRRYEIVLGHVTQALDLIHKQTDCFATVSNRNHARPPIGLPLWQPEQGNEVHDRSGFTTENDHSERPASI
jgi:hypothetical protein